MIWWVAHASAQPLCTTPEVLHQRALGSSPAQLPKIGGIPTAMAGGRTVYGEYYDHYYNTEHFTINWWANVSPVVAEAIGDALEVAWDRYIDELGWPAPVSSDTYYVWVLLDPNMPGTGVTYEYFSDVYPDGYPVISLNPNEPAEFLATLAAHEFMHAIQYGMRDLPSQYGEEESWYWEASANYASDLALPDLDVHQYTSEYYALQSHLRFDSEVGQHEYGMFVFNDWLEGTYGSDILRDVWALSGQQTGITWDLILEEATKSSAADLWGGFTGSYGNGQLRESHLHTPVEYAGWATDGATNTLPRLGTDYLYDVQGGSFEASGNVVLSGPDGVMDVVTLQSGDRLAVTALSDGATYTLSEVKTPATLDTGVDEPTPTEDTGSEGVQRITYGDKEPDNKGCSAVGATGGLSLWIIGLLTSQRRR